MPNRLVAFYSRKDRKPNGKYADIGELRTYIGHVGQDAYMDDQGRIPRWRAQELVDEWNVLFAEHAKYEVEY